MTRMWTPGGAAERFDRLVDPVGGRLPPGSESSELLDLVTAIRGLPEVAPRPAYTTDLRARLLVEADRLAVARATPAGAGAATQEARLRLRPRSESTRRRRLTVVAGTLTALGVSAGVGVAAQTALPGESLYGVKRALETAHTQVTASDSERGGLLLGNAADRLAETLAVLDNDDVAGTTQLSATLDSFSEEAATASTLLLDEYARTGDQALVEQLRTFTAASSTDLTAMRSDMPESGQAAWLRATDTVATIDTDALAACPLCSADLSSLTLPTTPDFSGAREPSASGGADADPQRPGSGSEPEGRTRPDRAGSDGSGSGGNGNGGGGGTVSSPGAGLGAQPPTTPRRPAPEVPDQDGGDPAGLGGVAKGLTDGVERGLRGGSDGSTSGGGSQGDGSRGSNGGGSKGGSNGGSGLDLGGIDDLIP